MTHELQSTELLLLLLLLLLFMYSFKFCGYTMGKNAKIAILKFAVIYFFT